MALLPRGAALVAIAPIFICSFGAGAAEPRKAPPADQDPTFKFTAEPIADVSGGKREGATYAQQVELNLHFDLAKSSGGHGLVAHVTFVNRAGENASALLAGDTLFQAQAVYGGTRHAPIHLVQAYLEEETGSLDIAAGRLPVGEAFAQSPLYCQFMNTAICGYPHSLPAKEGFTAFPNSTWGARLRASVSSAVSLQSGVYQVRPKTGGKWGLDWGWSGTTGTYFPVEVRWEPSLGSGAMPGHYKLGAGYDTSEYPDNFLDSAGRPFALSGEKPRMRDSRHSLYILADQMISRHGMGDRNGLVVMAGYVHSDPKTSQIADFAFGGLIDQGLIPSRPHDSAGIVLAYAKISSRLTATQRLQQQQGLPLERDAVGVQSSEMIVEADYEAKINDHLKIMPDIQYVVRPSASHFYRNALLAGMRITAQF